MMGPRFRQQQTSYRIVTFRNRPKFVSECKFILNKGDAETWYNSMRISHDWDGLAFVEVMGESFEILKSHNLGGHVLTLDGEYKILPLNSAIHEAFCKCSDKNTQTQGTTK